MNLKTELAKRCDLFKAYWQRYLTEEDPVNLYQAAYHLPRAGGKHLRPCLALLAGESVQGKQDYILPFASALELIHNFTLVHDDIMDKSTLRRNIPTVHTKYSEPTAILAGDLLFAKAFAALYDLTVDYPTYKELTNALVHCVLEICEGQQLDMEYQQKTKVTEAEYLTMVHKKTAVLFRLAARGGAILGGGTTKEIQALTDYGTCLGLSFQIWDDYLDLSSSKAVLGKDIGNDIRNGKKTLIAVHALSHAQGNDKKIFSTIFGNPKATEKDIRTILTLFRDLDSIDYAKRTASNYTTEAKKTLENLKDSPAREILTQLIDYTMQREK
ncbi:MAG: polyprenyl synthetase family protein [Methanobacteriota archaeon]